MGEISGRGEGIRTPGPMLPKHVRYQTALHPGLPCRADFLFVVHQATCYIIHQTGQNVNPHFSLFLRFLKLFCHPPFVLGKA